MRRNVLRSPAGRRDKFRNARYGPGKQRPAKRGTYIDPTRFVNKAVAVVDEAEFIPRHKFTDFGLMPEIEAVLAKENFTIPTPVQDGAIPPALQGRDVIGLANTGTGKTAAFVLPIIQRLRTDDRMQNKTVLIMAPTRELAIQINEDFKTFSRGMRLYSALIVGGANMRTQISQLRRRPHVVVGTPGRLKDLHGQNELKLGNTGIVVLDEADRMLDMGFIKDIQFLLGLLPRQRQSLCFSATITQGVRTLLDGLLSEPVTISVRTRETSDHVEQDVIRADSKNHKIQILTDLLRQPEFDKVLVFGETKWSVQRLAETLSKHGHTAEAIHGNKSQPQRQRALRAFKEGKVNVLVATDVASRGLDIPNVSHVINFDQPENYDSYVHRIGRTGRAGNRGKALTFVATHG